MRYSDIDPILMPWAASHQLHVHTQHHDEEVRVIAIVDDAGDEYQLYSGPDPKDFNYPNSDLAVVGVSLSKRGNKKHHAFYRERQQFTFQQLVQLSRLSAALDEAWLRVHEWIIQSGHYRPNA